MDETKIQKNKMHLLSKIDDFQPNFKKGKWKGEIFMASTVFSCGNLQSDGINDAAKATNTSTS